MNKDWVCALAAMATLGAGCSLDGPTSSARRAPVREAPRVAPIGNSDAEPVQVFLSRGTPTDSDGDGYADTIPVIVYLFPRAEESQVPVWTDGEFEFRLLDQTQRLVARWVFPPDVADASRQQLPPGPAYSFFLRLGGDSDRMPTTSLELSGVFRTMSGRMVTSQGSAAVTLGSN
ncbi:MAG: hypothetical protein RIB60_08980 [Phycisphaerales bacterium]